MLQALHLPLQRFNLLLQICKQSLCRLRHLCFWFLCRCFCLWCFCLWCFCLWCFCLWCFFFSLVFLLWCVLVCLFGGVCVLFGLWCFLCFDVFSCVGVMLLFRVCEVGVRLHVCVTGFFVS
jgi:hypothetical protein